MNQTHRMTVQEAIDLIVNIFTNQGMPTDLAIAAAKALVLAEQDGLPSHGLSRVPFYVAQMQTGKVNASARPQVQQQGAVMKVDVGYGLAFAAIELAVQTLLENSRLAELGLMAICLTHSHHFGVAGHAVEAFANQGLLAFACSNTPAAIAPWGGNRALMGTNPIAFAAPRLQQPPVVIDLSLSRVARGKIMLASQQSETIPDDWALDAKGQPTTDPHAALNGSMLPMGDAKGAALALMVELLTAGLCGGNFGFQASSLFEAQGEPPNLSQWLFVINPDAFAPGFLARIEVLLEAMQAQPGVRIPGQKRLQSRAKRAHELIINAPLYETLQSL